MSSNGDDPASVAGAPRDGDAQLGGAARAAAIRNACVAAALDAWDDAGMRGLCAEGRREVAIGAIRALDLASVREAE